MVSKEDMKTYRSGPTFRATCDVTKGAFANACSVLGCRPEPISSGGMVFMDDRNAYKSVRMWGFEWPWINGDEMTTWWKNQDILIRKGTKVNTFLKAFYNAPAWTRQEIDNVIDSMAVMGMVTNR